MVHDVTNLAVLNPVMAPDATNLHLEALNEVGAMPIATHRRTRRYRSSRATLVWRGGAAPQECDGSDKFFDTGWLNV
jgi:hypothetical protein